MIIKLEGSLIEITQAEKQRNNIKKMKRTLGPVEK